MKAFLAIIGPLLIVIMVILVTYWAAKYLQQRGGGSSSQCFRVIDRIVIGREQYVVLLAFQDKQYLLGVSSQSVNLLERIDEPYSGAEVEGFAQRLALLKKDGWQKGRGQEGAEDEN